MLQDIKRRENKDGDMTYQFVFLNIVRSIEY